MLLASPVCAADLRALQEVDQLYAHRDVSGNWSASVSRLELLLAQDPQDYEVLWRLARSYSEAAAFGRFGKKDVMVAFGKGEAAGAQAIMASPSAIEGYLWHAAVLGKRAQRDNLAALGAVQTVILDMQEVMRLEPACPTAYYVLATVYRQAPPVISVGNITNAKHYIDRAVSLNPNSIRFYYEYGLIALALRDKAGAIKAFEKVATLPLEVDEEGADARYLQNLRADALSQLKRLRKKQ